MEPIDCERLVNRLLPAVLEAGRIELRHLAAGVAVEHKADSSPVTAADREAETVLLDGLWNAARDIPVVAEESVSMGIRTRRSNAYFLVDPLDGTREFVRGGNEFTVNVGLVVDGDPVFGMIYAPALAALYATVGTGRAVMTTIAPAAVAGTLDDRHLHDLRTREPKAGFLLGLESKSCRAPGLDAFQTRLGVVESRAVSSSLKFCLIARGEADCYARLGPTSEWDTAAGHAILTAAGGAVTTMDGAPLKYGLNDSGYVNPHFVAWGKRPAPRAGCEI